MTEGLLSLSVIGAVFLLLALFMMVPTKSQLRTSERQKEQWGPLSPEEQTLAGIRADFEKHEREMPETPPAIETSIVLRKRGLPDRTDIRASDPFFDTQPEWLKGDDSFPLAVIGEGNYQEALEDISGGYPEEGVNLVVWGDLIPDITNQYDKNAVRVEIGGQLVGHLSREEAKAFRDRVAKERRQEESFRCKANIRGGWDRGDGDVGSFGVKLDVLLYD